MHLLLHCVEVPPPEDWVEVLDGYGALAVGILFMNCWRRASMLSRSYGVELSELEGLGCEGIIRFTKGLLSFKEGS